jgi:hypothetical protein
MNDGYRPAIRMDQMMEGKRYFSTVASGCYTKVGERYFYTNAATGEHRAVNLPKEENRNSWAYMVYEAIS